MGSRAPAPWYSVRAMRGRTPVIGLGLALAVLAAWRAACVLAGPDVDTDAYAHHMIARAILADPARPRGALGVAAALSLRAGAARRARRHDERRPLDQRRPVAPRFRSSSSGTCAARRDPRRRVMSADATALVAALLSAACPIAMQMGTTAQSEPLFALLALGRRHRVPAATLRRDGRAARSRGAHAIRGRGPSSPPSGRFSCVEPLLARVTGAGRPRSGARAPVDRRGGAGGAHPRVGRPAAPRRRPVVRLPRADARVRERGDGRRSGARRDRPRARRPLLPRLRRRARPRSRRAARGVRRRRAPGATRARGSSSSWRRAWVRVAHVDEPIVARARPPLRRRRAALRDVRRAGSRGDRRGRRTRCVGARAQRARGAHHGAGDRQHADDRLARRSRA